MKSWRIRFATVVLGLMIVAVVGWILLYPPPSDPKNIEYVLWKARLYPMNLDMATGTMVGDRSRDKLVVGKTEAELRSRFGYLLPLADTTDYNKMCYESSDWKGSKVLFIRDSQWMVVFHDDKATDLVLIKGC